MTGLAEIRGVRQIPDQPPRRWFWSRALELTVWLNRSGIPTSFQLAYDKHSSERVLTWTPERGYLHSAVDDGESKRGLRYKGTPLLVASGRFDATRVLQAFQAESSELPREIAAFVVDRLKAHPSYAASL